MGFGMRKEVYTRRPKASFGKMKKIYGEHMEDFHKSKNQKNEWSEKDKEAFRKFISNKLKRDVVEDGLYNGIIFMAVAAIVSIAIYLAWF